MLQRRKKEEDRAETTGSVHWKTEPKLLFDSSCTARVMTVGDGRKAGGLLGCLQESPVTLCSSAWRDPWCTTSTSSSNLALGVSTDEDAE